MHEEGEFKVLHSYRHLFVGVHVLLVCAVLVILGIIVNSLFFPFGKWTVHFSPTQKNRFITGFASKEKYQLFGTSRTGGTDTFQLITADPVYLKVLMPKLFSSVKVRLLYKNEDGQPVVNLGFFDSKANTYRIRGLAYYNDIIESLSGSWQTIRDQSYLLLQKRSPEWERKTITEQYLESSQQEKKKGEDGLRRRLDQLASEENAALDRVSNVDSIKKYSSVSDFFNNPPPPEQIASYRFPFEDTVTLPSYKATTELREFSVAIRGAHTFYTYIKDETLNVQMMMRDINRDAGSDPLTIHVSKAGRDVWVKRFPDDGETKAVNTATEPRQIKLELPRLAEGVYRIDVQADDDIFLTEFATTQHLLVAKGNLFLAANPEYAEVLGANAKYGASRVFYHGSTLTANTFHTDGLQTLAVGDKALPLMRVKEDVTKTTDANTWVSVLSPKNDVMLSGDGFFAFDQPSAFVPLRGDVQTLTSTTNLDQVDYILADYPVVSTDGQWTVAEYTEVNPPYTPEKQLSMIINVPGLSESKRTFKIHQIDLEFNKAPWSADFFKQKAWSLIHKILKR